MTNQLTGWLGNRADAPAAIDIDAELAREFVNAPTYDHEAPLGRALLLWLAREDGRNLAWDPALPANQAAIDELYELIRIIERRDGYTCQGCGHSYVRGSTADLAHLAAASVEPAIGPPAAAQREAIAATSRRSMALGGDPILLPVRLVWLDQFPRPTVWIDAFDDGARIWVDTSTLARMAIAVREAMPVEGAQTARELMALDRNRLERYDVTDFLGGREHINATSAAIRLEKGGES